MLAPSPPSSVPSLRHPPPLCARTSLRLRKRGTADARTGQQTAAITPRLTRSRSASPRQTITLPPIPPIAVKGAGKSSLRAFDDRGGGGPSRGKAGKQKRLLNGPQSRKNKNFIKNDEMARYEFNEDPNVKAKTDDHELAAALGFPKFDDGPDRLGWLLNFCATQKEDKDSGHMLSAVACIFVCQDGSAFKAEVEYAPYFYLQVADKSEAKRS